jgi:ABC-type multidrug transport system fused ATPase/permease subunit
MLPQIDFRSIKKIYTRFGPFLKPYWKQLGINLAAILLLIVIELLKPWPLKVIFDFVLLDTPGAYPGFWKELSGMDKTWLLLLACVSMIALALASGLLGYYQNLRTSQIGQKVVHDLRLHLFSHVQRLPQTYHDTKQSGDMLMRLTGDISMLKDMIVGSALTITSQFFIVIGMIAIMVWVDWQLALLALAVLPLLSFSIFKISREIKGAASKQRYRESRIASSLHETITSISTVKAFSREKYEEKKFAKETQLSLKAGLRTTRLEGRLNRVVEVITAAGTALVLWVGVKKVLKGAVTPGDLLVFVAYLRGVYRPLRQLANLTTRMAKAAACGERVVEILDIQPVIYDYPGSVPAPQFQGKIRLEKVEFSYNDGQPVLHDISFQISAGQIVAIVGPSGSGKSTLLRLLLRLYDPRQGTIYVDDQDIKTFQVDSYRRKIGSVFQNPLLFRASIRENIAYADPETSLEKIQRAARKANAHYFISRLPQGYETVIGESGNTLSGGQKQRIAIARAILKNTPILLLDEPTAALDARIAARVMEALKEVMQERTTLMVTHAQPVMEQADLVLYMQEGRIVESGSHQELWDKSGEYYHFLLTLESQAQRQESTT